MRRLSSRSPCRRQSWQMNRSELEKRAARYPKTNIDKFFIFVVNALQISLSNKNTGGQGAGGEGEQPTS